MFKRCFNSFEYYNSDGFALDYTGICTYTGIYETQYTMLTQSPLQLKV